MWKSIKPGSDSSNFHAELRPFFIRHLHSPHSTRIRDDLEKIWLRHRDKPNVSVSPESILTADWIQTGHRGDGKAPDNNDKDALFPVGPSLRLLKYLSRRHGLPPTLTLDLITLLDRDPENDLDIKWVISQTLKNAVSHHGDAVTFQQIINSLQLVSRRYSSPQQGHDQDEYKTGILIRGIRSQLLQMLALKLTPDTWAEHQSVLAPILRNQLPLSDSRTQSIVTGQLLKIGTSLATMDSNSSRGHQEEVNGSGKGVKGVRVDIESDTWDEARETIPIHIGSDILSHVKRNQGQGHQGQKAPVADAVRSQQTSTSVVKTNVSEKQELEKIDLSAALSSSKTRGKSTSVAETVAPAVDNSRAESGLSWWYPTTGMQVDRFWTLANNGDTIARGDMEYLRDKFGGWKISLRDTSTTTILKIADIFSIISKTHLIPDDVLNDLTTYGFKDSGETTNWLESWSMSDTDIWDQIRMKLLIALAECSKRRKGKLPPSAHKTLTKFSQTKDCTSEMKTQIWKILERNDDNLVENFGLALNHLKSLPSGAGDDDGEPIVEVKKKAVPGSNFVWKLIDPVEAAAVLTSRIQFFTQVADTKSEMTAAEKRRREELEILIQALEYIHEQSVFPQRALDLEKSTKFISLLLEILCGGQVKSKPPLVRAKVAQIICDLLDHAEIILPSDSLQNFLESLQDSETDDDWIVQVEERALFQTSIVQSILKLLNRKDFKPDGSKVQEDVLELLVQVAARDGADRKTEALAIVTLGNLTIRFPRKQNPDPNPTLQINIPNGQRLASKLVRLDTVDRDGVVQIVHMTSTIKKSDHRDDDRDDEEAKDDKGSSDKKDDEKAAPAPKPDPSAPLPGVTFISAMAAQIILHSIKQTTTDLLTGSTWDFLVRAVSGSPDKATRILTSECMWEVCRLSPGGNCLLPENIQSLRPFTSEIERIPDVRILTTAVICQSLRTLLWMQQKYPGNSNVDLTMTSRDLLWLTRLYAIEPLLLGEADFTNIVNGPILEVLQAYADSLHFPEQTNQLLALLLKQDEQSIAKEVKVNGQTPSSQRSTVLNLIRTQIHFIATGDNPHFLPGYLQDAIESVFLSVESDSPVLVPVLEVLAALSVELKTPLSDLVLEELDKLLGDDADPRSPVQLLVFSTLLSSNNVQDLPPRIFSNFDLGLGARRLLVTLTSNDDENFRWVTEFRNLTPKKTDKDWTLDVLATIQTYIEVGGLRLSPVALTVLELSLKTQSQTITAAALRCVTLGAENGQTFPLEVLQLAFASSKTEELPSLALAVVRNNQTLPPDFVAAISTEFCTAGWSWIFSQEEKPAKTFAILNLLLQNNYPFPTVQQLINLTDKFCLGWEEENGGTHRQRLEILSALAAHVNYTGTIQQQDESEISGENVAGINYRAFKRVFVQAMNGENAQFLETGLHGFIALPRRVDMSEEERRLSPEDFDLLIQIQRRPGSSESVKNSIADFFSRQKQKIPPKLQAQLNLSKAEGKTDAQFLEDLPKLIEWKDWDFFESSSVQIRLANILQNTGQKKQNDESQANQEKNRAKVLNILAQYPRAKGLPMSTLEAVAFALANDPGNSKGPCLTILQKALKEGVTLSSTVIRYLQVDVEFPETANLLLQIQDSSKTPTTNTIQGTTLHLKSLLQTKTPLDLQTLQAVEQNLASIRLTPPKFINFLTLFSPTLLKTAIKSPSSIFEALPSLVPFIAHNVPFTKEITGGALENAGTLLEASINQGVTSDPKTLKAFAILLDQGYKGPGSVKTTLKTLTALYQNTKTELNQKMAVLSLFSSLFRLHSQSANSDDPGSKKHKKLDQEPFIPFETVDLLLQELQGSSGPLRKLSLAALCFVRKEQIRPRSSKAASKILGALGSKKSKRRKSQERTMFKDVENLQEDFRAYLNLLAIKVFRDIYQGYDNARIEWELSRDPEFTLDVISLLFSLDYWDLSGLRKGPKIARRSQWLRILLNSDFLSTHAEGSPSVEFELQQLLHRLIALVPDPGQGQSKKDGQETTLEESRFQFLQLLCDKCRELPSTDSPFYLLQSLAELTYPQILDVLHDPGFPANLATLREKTVGQIVQQKLEAKLTFKVSVPILEMFSSRLVQSAGVELALAILSHVSSFDSLESLEVICEVIENAGSSDIETFRRDLKRSLETNTKVSSPREILTTLQIQILLKLDIPADFPRKNRLERILTAVLNNGVKFDDIRTLVQMANQAQSQSSKVKVKGHVTIGQGQDEDKSLYSPFEHVLFQASQYQLGPVFFSQLVHVLQGKVEKKGKKGSEVKANAKVNPLSIEEWIPVANRLVSEEIFEGKTGRKDLEHVMSEFRLKNSRRSSSYKWAALRDRFVNSGYEWEFLKLKVLQVLAGDKRSILYTPVVDAGLQVNMPFDLSLKVTLGTGGGKMICDWDATAIRNWARAVSNKFQEIGNEIAWDSEILPITEGAFYMEALMVAKRALFIRRNFNLTQVQVLSLLVALQKLDKDKDKQGQLQEVATGSGKSALIAILAVIKALTGQQVDVYTSSPVLAERDAKEWSKFFEMFGLRSASNGDKSAAYLSGLKPCYTADIVYGDPSQFEFDFLREKYSDLGTRGGRRTDFAIVDEVDSMLVDDAGKLARLSSTLPGMDLLEPLYHLIWNRLTFLKNHLFRLLDHTFYVEGALGVHSDPESESGASQVTYQLGLEGSPEFFCVSDIFNYLSNASDGDLDRARIHPIEPIEEFVVSHLTSYAKGLIQIGASPDEPEPIIKLPGYLRDFAQGQISKWVDSALTALSYEENVNYIVEDGQVKPVDFKTTGVVQSSTSWNNGLHQFIGLKHSLRISPETLTTNFMSNPAMIAQYNGNLMGFTGTLGSTAGREALYRVYKVKLLSLPETNFKRYIQFPDISAPNADDWLKEIVISTLAESGKGRGVLVICETIAKAEEVVAALAHFKVKVKVYTKNEDENGRVESRIEKIHPGDVIVATNLAGRGTDIKTAEIEEAGGLHVCLTFLPDSKRVEEQAFGRTSRQGNKGTGQLIFINSTPDFSLEAKNRKSESPYKIERDAREKSVLDDFETTQLPVIRMKDVLFEQFRLFFHEHRCALKAAKEVSAEHVLQTMEERWAMFLRKVDDGDVSLSDALGAYTEFQTSLEMELKKGPLELLASGRNLFHFVALGNEELQRERVEAARGYFETAINMDRDFAVGAFLGNAAAILKGPRPSNADGWDDRKEAALTSLNEALFCLHTEMALLNAVQTLAVERRRAECQGQVEDPYEFHNSALNHQLLEKTNLLGKFVKNAETNKSALEKALRRTYCQGKNSESGMSERVMIPDKAIASSSRSLTPKSCQEYELTFHDLTVWTDAGDRDQAVKTLGCLESWISSSRDVACEVNLVCPGSDLKKLLEWERTHLVTKTESFVKYMEKGQISLEIRGLTLDPENTGQIRFPLDDLKVNHGVHVRSYSLEVIGEAHMLEKLAIDPRLNEPLVVELHFELKFGSTFVQILSNDSALRSTQVTNAKENDGRLTFIKVSGIEFFTDLAEVTEVLQQVQNSSPSTPFDLNLTLCGLEENDKAPLIEAWDCILSKPANRTVILSGLKIKAAKEVIPILRDLKMGFQLQVSGLDPKGAQTLLDGAVLFQEDMVQSKMEQVTDLYMKDALPCAELQQLQSRGLVLLITFHEQASVPWISITTLCIISAVQIGLGTALICTGVGAPLGISLITEGMSDLVQARTAYTSRSFNWQSYAVQKSISVAISAYTLGLGNIKDGAQGMGMIGKSVFGKKIIETTTTETMTKAMTNVGMLKFAAKKVALSAAETTGRVAIKSGLDYFANFCFEQVRSQIQSQVSDRVKENFYHDPLRATLRAVWTLEKCGNRGDPTPGSTTRLQSTVTDVVQSSFNPMSNFWLNQWNSVGLPLVTGILSDPKYVGSSWNTLVLVWGAATGVHEIVTAIQRISDETLQALTKDKVLKGSPSNVQVNWKELFTIHCGIAPDLAQVIANQVQIKTSSSKNSEDSDHFLFQGIKLTPFSPDKTKSKEENDSAKSAHQRAETFIKRLATQESKFDLKSSEMSQLTKAVIDLVTNHIIKVANAHLVSPLLSKASGMLVASMSGMFQNYFLGGNLDNQILEAGKEYYRAYQQKELVTLAEGAADQPSGGPVPPQVEKLAGGVENGDPATIDVITAAGRAAGRKIKTVTDPNYVRSEADDKEGVDVVLFIPPSPGDESTGVGHFQLYDETTGKFVTVPSTGNDCAFAIVAHLEGGGKTAADVRDSFANFIRSHPETFKNTLEIHDWFYERDPEKAAEFLMQGGKEGKGDAERDETGSEDRRNEDFRNQEALSSQTADDGQDDSDTRKRRKTSDAPPQRSSNDNEKENDPPTTTDADGLYLYERDEDGVKYRRGRDEVWTDKDGNVLGKKHSEYAEQPLENVRRGSATRQDTGTAELSRALSNSDLFLKEDGTPSKVVQGHLMNQGVGGTGDPGADSKKPVNIEPITNSTNQVMRSYDEPYVDVAKEHSGSEGTLNVHTKVYTKDKEVEFPLPDGETEIRTVPVVQQLRPTVNITGNDAASQKLAERYAEDDRTATTGRGHTTLIKNTAASTREEHEPSSETTEGEFQN